MREKKVRVEDAEAAMDDELVNAIGKLQEVQDQLEQVNEEASDKVLEVEQKYNEIRRPVYATRSSIIENIPDFWLTVFLSHPTLHSYLTEDDQKVFKYLQSLDVEDFKDVKSGYTITFTFRPNPYFDDQKLRKVFHYTQEGTLSITSTQPQWKPGMNPVKEQQNGEKGRKRTSTESEESFFRWFETDLKSRNPFEIQDEVAEILKDDLWPNPLKYFSQDGDEGEDDENGELDGEDQESEEDDEDKESEEGSEGEEDVTEA